MHTYQSEIHYSKKLSDEDRERLLKKIKREDSYTVQLRSQARVIIAPVAGLRCSGDLLGNSYEDP